MCLDQDLQPDACRSVYSFQQFSSAQLLIKSAHSSGRRSVWGEGGSIWEVQVVRKIRLVVVYLHCAVSLDIVQLQVVSLDTI